ncbi:unnamed protein product [Rotaria sordida]|uniref:F-box domain-containing protein n=1 Tax=Rotaria sordida TaxID=392033 RepID=A0A819K3N7_9BILA|nr:unnamed protein product [Rotaria sordida]
MSTKRQQKTVQSCDIVKRKKLNIDSKRKFYTHFEDLSNEIIYEIFDYLDIYHIYEAFSNLNKRFDNFLVSSTFPIKINISSMSKTNFQYYYTNILIPNKHRITSICLSNLFIVDFICSSPRIILTFIQLERLILDNIQLKYIQNIPNHLISLFNLHSLTISLIDKIQNKNNFYYSIFRLSTLKYCKLSFESYIRAKPLLISSNEYSSIEHLIIHNESTLDEFRIVLSYLPQLRRLYWNKLCRFNNKQDELREITLKYLKHVSLQFKYTYFDQFEPLIIDLFHQVEVLRISTSFDRSYFDANRWERLISSYMPHLRIFDIQHNDNSHDQMTCHNLNNLFISSFWLQHQWFFTHQCYSRGNWKQINFYSTNPYRRKHYTIYGEIEKENCLHNQETNLDLVDHVHIQGEKTMLSCLNYFPNATNLTLSHSFNKSIDEIIINLNQILPLIQLTTLSIDCDGFSFDKVIELIHFTPNIHTLKVYSMNLYRIDSILPIQKSKTFRLVSNRNLIKNFTIDNRCIFEQAKLLINLCRRLEHINIDVLWQDFESILQLLLTKNNNNTCHLCSLCLKYGSKRMRKKLEKLIKSKNLLDNYSIKLIRSKLYLWW